MRNENNETLVNVWVSLMRAQQAALSQIEKALKNAGLPPLAWYDVLLEIDREGEKGLRPFEIERRTLLTQYNLSRLLDRIEASGYILRASCNEDGRGQVVTITETGKQMRKRMWPVYSSAIQASIGKNLSETDAQNLNTLLRMLGKRTD
jgi:DNA-binding MarR family transcriptional regulator